jgi:hypothetical protein
MAGNRGMVPSALGRRYLLHGAAMLPVAAAALSLSRMTLSHSARTAASFGTAEFATAGVSDIDWLLDARYTRLLDTIVASPGAARRSIRRCWCGLADHRTYITRDTAAMAQVSAECLVDRQAPAVSTTLAEKSFPVIRP